MPKTIKQLVETCRACPSQWEALTEDNKRVDIHYRGDRLTVEVEGELVFVGGGIFNDPSLGEITVEDMLEVTELIEVD